MGNFAGVEGIEGIIMNSPFWQKNVYRFVFFACGLFVMLTIIAMIAYPGGLYSGTNTEGYDFFRNFFSDLGRVNAPNGEPNTISLIAFFIALTTVGIGLILFFIAFRNFFVSDQTGKRASLLGTAFGMTSGLCFIIVACAPYDINFGVHYEAVFWAFRTFLLAVAIYAYVIFRQDVYPRKYGWIFITFAVSLAAYILLLEFGPEATTPSGLVIQATGQKIITYISILSVMAQS